MSFWKKTPNKPSMTLGEKTFELAGRRIRICGVPETCPHCNKIVGMDLAAIIPGGDSLGLQVVLICFQCPACKELTIGRHYEMGSVLSPIPDRKALFYPDQRFTPILFSDLIDNLSINFCMLYNQAAKAEHYGCGQISGAGYRKALEFLVKDFAIHLHPGEEETIKKTLLAKVIDDYLDSRKIKEIAKRAVWLGNDETHYQRQWEDKDIEDLKKLISITVNFIESDLEADAYTTDMPSGKKGETK
ncbi:MULTISPECIES: hypothetical protein [Candidatus Avelusimicrobium]|uniref:hypothetical protein n=1 Tax=Candidatus Avelusimicrobium TaxID=2840538 RepID=UPI002070BECE|nr:MAG TPA: zinc-ribbon domain protein [Caudoviricetes sp.]